MTAAEPRQDAFQAKSGHWSRLGCTCRARNTHPSLLVLSSRTIWAARRPNIVRKSSEGNLLHWNAQQALVAGDLESTVAKQVDKWVQTKWLRQPYQASHYLEYISTNRSSMRELCNLATLLPPSTSPYHGQAARPSGIPLLAISPPPSRSSPFPHTYALLQHRPTARHAGADAHAYMASNTARQGYPARMRSPCCPRPPRAPPRARCRAGQAAHVRDVRPWKVAASRLLS